MDPIDKALYNMVTAAVRSRSINVNQVINIITFSMIAVEKFKQLHGREKLQRVIHVLREVITARDIGLPPSVEAVLTDMLANEAVIIGIIESIVDATKNINVGGRVGAGLLACLTCK